MLIIKIYDIHTTYHLIALKDWKRNLYDFSYMEDQDELRLKLIEYKNEHKALDRMIDEMTRSDQPVNLFQMQQLKKKKLWFKDMIQKLESALIDDIIA